MEPTSKRYGPLFIEQLRDQVNNLMAAAQLLTPAIREQEERRYDQYLAILNQSLYRLLRLMNNLDFVQQLEGDAPPVPHTELLDLSGLCRELGDQVIPLAQQAGVRFVWEAETPALLLTGDAALLRRMLLNLISNALRAAGKDGEAGLRLHLRNNRAIITIWDNGAESTLPSEEEGADELLLQKHDGLSLGLLIARQIAVLHGGTVVFECREERGMNAVVSLDAQHDGKPGITLRTPKMSVDTSGGFSPVLVELSSVLPFNAFLADNIE